MNTANNDSIMEQALSRKDDDDLSVGVSSDSHLDSTDSSELESETQEHLASDETRAVFRLRLLVIGILFLAAGIVSLVVYGTSDAALENEFSAQFEGSAEKILKSFEGVISQKVSAVGSLGVAFTSYALGQNDTWPFVTMNSFQQRAASVRSLSSALFVNILPVVTEETRDRYEKYTVENLGWMGEGLAYQKALGLDKYIPDRASGRNLQQVSNSSSSDVLSYTESGVGTKIYEWHNFERRYDPNPGPYIPVWQSSPVLPTNAVNLNLHNYPLYEKGIRHCLESGEAVLGGFDLAPPGSYRSDNIQVQFFATILSIAAREEREYNGDPMSTVYFPVFDNYSSSREVVGVMNLVINWASYFENILPPNVNGVVVVLDNSCDGSFTYEINGESVRAVGHGDLHESKYDSYLKSGSFDNILDILDGSELGVKLSQIGCDFSLRVYPSTRLRDEWYDTSTTKFLTIAVALIFVFTIVMFGVYDRLVERRQKLVMKSVIQSNAIVSSLFPENVRERLLGSSALKTVKSGNRRIKSFLNDGKDDEHEQSPIADLFPYTTVMFADIAGFTAWSSSRDPAQVFILLQKLYHAFDIIAQQFKVFKVETIGDSYVAVAGLPNPQDNHAVIMARYSAACNAKVVQVMRSLEVKLGPETGDLAMRFGLHSGPVTAGVLRGERSRFQLFGDTVNTAARMESTGIPGRIQISQATADLLMAAGKDHWVVHRNDAVNAKGKGVLNTFWVVPGRTKSELSTRSSSGDSFDDLDPGESSGSSRLVDWVAELLLGHLKQVLARRSGSNGDSNVSISRRDDCATFLDEVKEAIVLPKFDPTLAAKQTNVADVEVPEVVVSQLRQYIRTIASKYHDNPFHNWKHACHVTMSVDKFLKRIVAPDLDFDEYNEQGKRGEIASQLHDYTHGINSDPMTQLAIVFSALIHDVDHRGISNQRLAEEDQTMAELYKKKSIAEQNSLDIAWKELMSEDFRDLRNCMFTTQDEVRRFRQLIVNVVLATDIFDEELNSLRKMRWSKAFGDACSAPSSVNDLRATIVIEHIIQASDVSHTMQHWHVYRKWNQCLYNELSLAHKKGRMAADPASFWYKGELGFFDNYVIPLAKKLKDCNVFGVSSDECLNYALRNRAEWCERGEELLEEMKQEFIQNQCGGEASVSAVEA